MQEIYSENLKKILQNKKKLEKELSIKIKNKGKFFFIEGEPENEYLALKVFQAINLGFPIGVALELKNEETNLNIINIRNLTKRKNLKEIKARIIGTYGKTISNIENLSECAISLHDNQVGIIGDYEKINDAIIAIESLIKGAKQGNVYARLEKERKKRRLKPPEKIINELKNEKN